MSDQSFTVTIDARFRDLDTMGHVNNSVFATYLEEARVAYFRDVIGVPLHAADTVVAHLTIDYHSPIQCEDEIVITLEVAELGNSSIHIAYDVHTNETLAASAETVQVVWDPETESSRPLPQPWRDQIEIDD